MPVYEFHYQTWDGARRGGFFRWFAIARFAWRELFSRRLFIWLFSIAWFQFLLRLALIYVLVSEPIQRLVAGMTGGDRVFRLIQVDEKFFKQFIDWQLPFCFFITFIGGANLIARDLQHRAVVLYATKPIRRIDYLVGKFMTLFLPLMAITWLQAILLFIAQWAVSPPTSPWRQHLWPDYLWIAGSITLYSALICATPTLLILAFSSLTRNGRYASAAFAIYIIGANMAAMTLYEMTRALNSGRNPAWLALSPFKLGLDLGNRLFRFPENSMSLSITALAAGFLLIWGLTSVTLLWRLSRSVRQGAAG